MRNELKTVRLRKDEAESVDRFLRQNRSVSSFSDLARLAILDFIQRRNHVTFAPVSIAKDKGKRPPFIWDYDLDEEEVRSILATQPFNEKKWLISRILEHAPFQEVWNYLTVDEIKTALPKLRLNKKRKAHWEFALHVWADK